MPQAQGSRVQLAYVAETTYGVTPATPQTQLLEFTDFTGDLNAQALTDESIRADRQTSFSRRGNSSTAGDLSVVLAPDNYDDLLEAVLQGTWATNELKVGTTQRSFSIERGYTDLNQYHVFAGCVFDKFSLEITPDALVKAQFTFMGSNLSAFSGTSIDSTPTAVPQKTKFYHEGGTFKEGGVTVGFLSALKMELNNNVTANNALGVVGVRNMTSGKASITGTVTALFEDAAMYNKFKNSTESSLEFTLVAGAETLTFKMPRVTYDAAKINQSGDGPITVELNFTALYNAGDANTLIITRA